MSTTQQQPDEFEILYLKERKKNSIFLVSIIVLAVLAAGSLAWAISSTQSSTRQFPGGEQGFDEQDGQNGFRGGPGGMGGMGMDIKNFFNDDGSLDTEQVEEMTRRSPSGSDSRFVDMISQQAEEAVENGDITQDQADELLEALDTTTESSNDS